MPEDRLVRGQGSGLLRRETQTLPEGTWSLLTVFLRQVHELHCQLVLGLRVHKWPQSAHLEDECYSELQSAAS